jgi:uncharacterized protein YhfF
VLRLAEADVELARDEGEGFGTVGEWRSGHERFWNDEVLPTLANAEGRRVDDDTLIVVQRFRLVDG